MQGKDELDDLPSSANTSLSQFVNKMQFLILFRGVFL